ncbi:phage tail protein [Escherichia fergusonii]|uniref:phage tail protein n=1 Tax=Escherichia fergusonii TaxID=564 RepID=UPI0020CEFD70|nr:phage tail protein [Escherichia fergusonii]MCP9660866.1 phage tail protein [Escherichia fergusonii]
MDDPKDIMLGIGDFVFSISTVAYNKLQRSDGWRWAEQTRFRKNDALQVTGRPNPTITIEGEINALFLGGCGIGLLSDLRSLGNQGKPQQLVLGTGRVMGYWVITELTETQSAFFMGGTPKKQSFTLNLKYYGSSI